MIFRAFLFCSVLLISACNSASVIEETVGTHDIVGKVINARTNTPVVSALVILTLPQGTSWTLPSSFLLGYGYTDSNGNFHIPANPQSVKNLRYHRASIMVDAYHPDFKQSVEFIPRNKSNESVVVKMQKGDVLKISSTACTYNNTEICSIVSDYLGI